jgi:transcription elongation factor GreA
MGTMEADILANPPRISNDSPIGKALMGKKEGAVVKVKTNAGTSEFKIVSFE